MATRSGVPEPLALTWQPATAGTHVFAIAVLVIAVFLVAMLVLVVVGIVMAVKRQRRRLEQFHVHAAQCGWRPVASVAPLPGPVGEAARSRRTRLMLGAQQAFALWLVWHQWTESTGSGDSTTHTTRNLTQYFLWLGPSYPTVRLERRTSVGAFFKPVRGIGTEDAEFDKRFMIRGPGEHEALRLLTPAVRQAMVAGYLPAWAIAGGVLILAYGDAPTVQTLQPRADIITYLARMLTHSGGI
jgi:hypothetical protein